MIDARYHYWIVAGQVYSSATNTYVAADDPAFTAWTDIGNTPTSISSESELADVLKPYQFIPLWLFNAPSFIQPTPTTYTKPQLAAYAADVRYRKAGGGCTVAGEPYLTDPTARNTIGSAHDYAVANPGHITDWKLADGTFIPLDEPQLAHVLQQVATFVQACFSCESTTVTSINGGTITTLAAIDAAFAAISNTFP